MDKRIIVGGDKRYLSEVEELKNGLPFGIFNKVLTDTGGTFLANNCNCNYITVVPFKRLANSISEDVNNRFEVFKIYEGVTYKAFTRYIQINDIHKITVTYDSFPKLLNWLERQKVNLSEYKVLIDEYHLLFEDLGYRADAIINLLNNLKRVGHYTFMSATPLTAYIPKSLRGFPYTEIQWDNSRITKVKVLGKPMKNVYKAVAAIISKFKRGDLRLDAEEKEVEVKQLFIFINSVKAIEQIARSVKLTADEVDVICADNQRNSFILDKLPISVSPRIGIPITFLTKTGFQGCNFFSNNALTIVVSDNSKEHTLIDVSTTLHQIAGRIRNNKEFNNIFKDRLWHIYSTNKRSFESQTLIDQTVNEIDKKTNAMMNVFNNSDEYTKDVLKQQLDISGHFCYYNRETKTIDYSTDLKEYLIYRYNLVNNVYRDGLAIKTNTAEANFNAVDLKERIEADKMKLESAVKTNYRVLLEEYLRIKKISGLKADKWDKEFPDFKEAFDVIGEEGIKTCEFIESRIKERVFSKSEKTFNYVCANFYNIVGGGNFISNKDAKDLLVSLYGKLQIRTYKPTVSMLYDCKWIKVEKAKQSDNGYRVNGIILHPIL